MKNFNFRAVDEPSYVKSEKSKKDVEVLSFAIVQNHDVLGNFMNVVYFLSDGSFMIDDFNSEIWPENKRVFKSVNDIVEFALTIEV